MIKRFFLTIACLTAGLALGAQNQAPAARTKGHTVDTYTFGTNWFVGVGGGLSVYRGDHDGQAAFGDILSPNYGISLGKWFSPHFGLRLSADGHNVKGLTQNNTPEGYTTSEAYEGKSGWGSWLYHQKFSFVNVHADLMFNLRTIILGNKPDQLWEPVPYIGVGFANVFTKPGSSSVTYNAGFLNYFNINRSLAISLDLKAMAAMDKLDGEVGGRAVDGMGTVAVGVVYKF